MSILFITHDLSVIAELADRVIVMFEGKIVEEGSVKEIFTQAKHPYTKGLLSCRPPLNKRLFRLPTVSDFLAIEAGTTDFKPDSKSNTISVAERKSAHEFLYAQKPIIKVEGLDVWFKQRGGFLSTNKKVVKAVDGVSFDIFPGETLGLVGESGCGKTTLGRSILQLIEPTAGRILFHDQNLCELTQNELRPLRKNLQMVFQDPYSSLNPRMMVGEALLEPMRIHDLYENDLQRKQKIIDILNRVGLRKEHYFRYPHEFSGGQQQRICIGRALVINPEFIICDESVSALDVSVQAQVINLLNELKRDFKFTCLFISHDLSVVRFMADRMLVMNNGKIEESGDADVMCSNPASEYTRRLIDAIPKGRIEDIEAAITQRKNTRLN
jgi:peptide/nickel transport system ATP-binding protein